MKAFSHTNDKIFFSLEIIDPFAPQVEALDYRPAVMMWRRRYVFLICSKTII